MKEIKWDWYGTWVIDWITYDGGNFSDAAWESFDIWKEAYLKDCPELDFVSDLELIEDHYCQAMEPVFSSWIFKFWLILNWPMSKIHSFMWILKRKFS